MPDWSAVHSLAGGAYQLRRARIPHALVVLRDGKPEVDADGLVTCNLQIAGGVITDVTQREESDDRLHLDLEGSQVWPALVDLHTHLDKGHIWPRAENPDGTHAGASAAVGADRKSNWNFDDVWRRFDFGVRCAFAHGTAAIRTHIDSHEAAQIETSWDVFRQMRERWKGRIELQAALMVMLDAYGRSDIDPVIRMVAKTGGALGGVTKIRSPLGLSVDEVDFCLDRLFVFAKQYGLDVDLHVDETLDPAAMSLRQVAQAAIRNAFKGRIVCGHCCSLAAQSEEVVRDTLSLCRDAGIAVVTLPMVNLYLQSRNAGRTPTMRGVAPVHELMAAGVKVAAASDNCRDPFFAFGDHDLVEVYREFVRIAHLDIPHGDWCRSVTATPAELMGLSCGVVRSGVAADLILFRARNMNELLSRPQSDRVVLRNGRPIDTSVPDYRELDDLFATA